METIGPDEVCNLEETLWAFNAMEDFRAHFNVHRIAQLEVSRLAEAQQWVIDLAAGRGIALKVQPVVPPVDRRHLPPSPSEHRPKEVIDRIINRIAAERGDLFSQ